MGAPTIPNSVRVRRRVISGMNVLQGSLTGRGLGSAHSADANLRISAVSRARGCFSAWVGIR